MAIEVNTALDRAQRKVSTANLANFTGVDCQLLVVKEDKRPVIMDGVTLGGKFKCASTAELEAGLATKLGKMDKAASAKVADSVSGENVTGAVANATNATNAVNAVNATNVQWTGVQSVPGNVKNAVAYTAQTLTDEQKAQIVQNLAGTFLPLSGGKMTGMLSLPFGRVVSTNTSSHKELLIGSDTDGTGQDGAYISLRNVASSTAPGGILLQTRESVNTNGPIFGLYPDGNIKWDNKEVVCHDSSSNTTNSSYIKFSDGTLICYGIVLTSTNPIKVVLPQPYVNNIYRVAIAPFWGNSSPPAMSTSDNSTTSFNIRCSNSSANVSWIVIGRWK